MKALTLLVLSLLVAGCGRERTDLQQKLEGLGRTSSSSVAEATEALKETHDFLAWLEEERKEKYPELIARAKELRERRARELATLAGEGVKEKASEIFRELVGSLEGTEGEIGSFEGIDSAGSVRIPLPRFREGVVRGEYLRRLQGWVNPPTGGDTPTPTDSVR